MKQLLVGEKLKVTNEQNSREDLQRLFCRAFPAAQADRGLVKRQIHANENLNKTKQGSGKIRGGKSRGKYYCLV